MRGSTRKTPTATYRLQLRDGMDFERAARLAPYLSRLGISHLYLSPIFHAVPGSTHGYDGIDFNEIDPQLGGYDGFVFLARALHGVGIGIILDIVPNHMGAHPQNPWWRSVLEWGPNSPYANHFDVDWTAQKLLVPRLGDHYGTVLRSAAMQLIADRKAGEVALQYGDMQLPLNPPSYATILTVAEQERFGALALKFAASTPAGGLEFKADLAACLVDPELAAALDRALEHINGDWEELHKIHEQQVWRLAHWRTARENLTYRRFFEIAELVGVKVEQPDVFEDVHRTILDLVKQGHVDGLRIDHIDGLADPGAYLARLRAAIGGNDFYIVVEKILGSREELRGRWPVHGTTGYEFIAALAQLLVDSASSADLTQAYENFVGEKRDLVAEVVATKRRTLTRNLAGELDHLADLASTLAADDIATRDLGRDTMRRAIVELASAMPVYRTYVDAEGASSEDDTVLKGAIDAARTSREVEDEVAFDFLGRLFKLDFADASRRAAALRFATRFQQTTGPLTAKAFEDTLFYRYNRLIAVNEVGGELDPLGARVERFHGAMQLRRTHPAALTSTATHDTKRGEDARARIYAISEAPLVWAAAVGRWAEMNRALGAEDQARPERESEWMFYQALLGAWPVVLNLNDAVALKSLAERMKAFIVKAAREAKLHTTWTQPDEKYERGLTSFVEQALDPNRSKAFLADFHGTVQPFVRAGIVNSLTQLVLKLFVPGIPDVYQGTETWDLALVDPDNRRPVDFERNCDLLKAEAPPDDLLHAWTTGAVKQRILCAGLQLRQSLDTTLEEGEYVPLEPRGPLQEHIVAFARRSNMDTVVVIGTRLSFSLLPPATPRVAAERWAGTQIHLPAVSRGFTDILTGRRHAPVEDSLQIAEVLRDLPVAVLSSRADQLG
jgi:(1->4)-alpha-D-glucan 1-alpha-D-glucosylmutase